MMHINGFFGHLSTWLLIAGGWIIISIVSSIAFGLIARMGGGERRGRK